MFSHQRRGRLGAQERPGEIDLQHALQSSSDVSSNGANTAIAGIVDQRIEPAETPLDFGDRARHRPGIGDVAMQPQRLAGGVKRCDALP